MGTREQENGTRKAAAKSCQSLDTWVSKVPRQEPSDTDNDSAICEDSSAETTTSDLSQLATVLQRDIEEVNQAYFRDVHLSLDPSIML